uniref:CCHC-type domain-containing protein n=1 Tax=Cannabis sativa TaxID=3483 RepID=A0A803NXT4_CANSA
MGSGPLPADTIQSVLGFNTLSFLDLARELEIFCCGHLYLSRDISLLSVLPNLCTACGVISNLVSGPVTMAAVNENTIVDEIIQETENVCLDDFSIEVSPDNELAKDTIAKSVVGKFYSKKVISNGTLRKALSGLWKLSPGWRFQTVRPKTFIFRLGSPKEVKNVLENGPWNLCCGYLLVAALPEDGKWESADLSNLDIWVKAMGVPLPYMTEACIHQMAGRMGKLIQANKVSRNGVILNDFLRFQVRLKLAVPLLAGVSLPDYGDKKVWSYFKYEKLPIFCFKCGVIGHVDADCSAKKRVVTVQDGSRLENDDPALKGMPLSASNEALIPEKGAEVRDGHTRVEKEGMEGVVSQRADNSFNVAYNDYVDTSKFPTQHVAGGIGAGSKRKKVSKELDIDSNFMDESRGNSCLIIMDKSGVKDVFAEASGVNVPEESDNCDDSGEQAKKARLFLDSL